MSSSLEEKISLLIYNTFAAMLLVPALVLGRIIELLRRETKITREIFKEKVGREPINDDLERCNCVTAGDMGHRYCGWCKKHDIPNFECGCRKT